MKHAIWLLVSAGCVAHTPSTSSTAGETFDEFKAHTYRETWAGGMYIVDGDTPIANDKQLYEFWEGLQQGGLIVDTVGGSDDRWDDLAKLHLTYCVDGSFG